MKTTKQSTSKKQLVKLLSPFIFIFLTLISCQQEDTIFEEGSNSFNTDLPFQQAFNFEYINKSLHLDENNFQVNWDNYEIINFKKEGFTTTYEFEAFLNKESRVASNLFHDKIIYKLIVTENHEKNYIFNVIRFEPFKNSVNKEPTSMTVEDFDGMKTTLNMFGQVNQIEVYKKGEIVSKRINEEALTTDEIVLRKEPAVLPECDSSSFYFNAKDCAESGGSGSGGWIIEATDHYTDWFKKDADGNIVIEGERYFYTSTRYDGRTYRWVYQPGGYDYYINTYIPDGDPHDRNYPHYDGARIIDDKLTGKEKCLHDLMELEGNLYIQKLLKNFEGNSEFDIEIESKDKIISIRTGNEINGSTRSPIDGVINILISTDKANSNKALEVARTILHEYVHADMFRKLNTKYSSNGDLEFKTTYEAFESGNFEATPQHNTIADLYIGEMTKALKDFHQNALVGDYNYLSNNGLNPIPDLFYEALAWQGLKDDGVEAYTSKSDTEKQALQEALEQYYHSTTSNCPNN